MKPERRRKAVERQLLVHESRTQNVNNVKKSPKKPRIEEVVASGYHFLDMNDDCIETICTFLPLDDLCSLSLTCKRVQCIAGDFFQRNYPNNAIRIQSFHRRSVRNLFPDEKYVEDLKPFIRNVCIQEYKGSACVDYLKANFGVNLREISLHGINSELHESHGIEIKEQLHCVESIKFVNCSIGDIYGVFLKHCKNVRHLGIDEPVTFNGRVTWTQHLFPSLDSLAYFDEANTNRADLGSFLRRNAQIKNVACKGTNAQRTVFQRAKNLELLILCFNSQKDFNRNFSCLKNYSEVSQTKRIKLEFIKRLELDQFTQMASIQRIHGYRGYLVENMQFPEIMRSMEHLRVLQLMPLGVSKIYIKRLANCLPNLEELHFTAIDMSLSFKNFFLPFCQNPQLKKIVITLEKVQYACTKSDIVEINRARESFDPNNLLVIYMEKKVLQIIGFNIPDNSKVILRPLSELKHEVHNFHLF